MKNLSRIIASIAGCELVGIIGGLFTAPAIPTWYSSLNKPFFTPPDWLFGPVWTTLYFLMGWSFFLIWRQELKEKKTKIAATYFLAQLGFNLIWSPVFFGLRSPLLGLIVIGAMWLLIIITMEKFHPLSKTAFFLLIPYLIWVSFAAILNAAILVLN